MSMVRLSCDHLADYRPPPRPEDLDLWCRVCGDYRTVIEIDIEWRIKCSHCNYGRKFGMAKDEAYAAAGRHSSRNPSHRIKITDGDEIEEYVGGTDPYIPEIQDWLQQNPTHQTGLRSLPNRDS